MYYYIYDDFVQDKKHEKEILKIENRLADLDIAGKIARLALFKTADELIRDEVKRGVKTVVAVGNDNTVFKVLNAVVDSGVVFGLIPIGRPGNIAKMFGIPDGNEACSLLANRRIERIDLGKINGNRFLTGVSLPKIKPEIVCDKSFILTPLFTGNIEVRNLAIGEVTGSTRVADPMDRKLEVVIDVGKTFSLSRKSKHAKTVVTVKRFAFDTTEPVTVLADRQKIRGKKFRISLDARKLKVIVGKGRMF